MTNPNSTRILENAHLRAGDFARRAGLFLCRYKNRAGGFASMMPPPTRPSWPQRCAKPPNGSPNGRDNRTPAPSQRMPTTIFPFFLNPIQVEVRHASKKSGRKNRTPPRRSGFFLPDRRSRFLIAWRPEPTFVKKKKENPQSNSL